MKGSDLLLLIIISSLLVSFSKQQQEEEEDPYPWTCRFIRRRFHYATLKVISKTRIEIFTEYINIGDWIEAIENLAGYRCKGKFNKDIERPLRLGRFATIEIQKTDTYIRHRSKKSPIGAYGPWISDVNAKDKCFLAIVDWINTFC